MCDFKEYNKNLFSVLLIILGVFLIVLIISTVVDIQDKISETKNTITVFDTGTIYVKPDLVLTTFSVITEEKTVAEVLEKNTKKMNSIIKFVKEQGIEEKDLKTISFNIYPRYEWYEEKECLSYPCPSGKRVLVGYEVRQSLEVKIRDMEKIGQIIEGGTAAGANEVADLQFTVDKEEELKKQARDQAIEKAKTKAKELAEQLGIKLVRINNFSESSVIPYFYGLKAETVPAAMGGEAPQIESGENKIEVTVTLTYEIR